MTLETTIVSGGPIFDGDVMHEGKAARFVDGVFVGLEREVDISEPAEVIDLKGDILAPGFVDLQVNGGGGEMFNGAARAETIKRIADAHRALGTTLLLPTLITDTFEHTQAAIAAISAAIDEGTPGVAGLHLEGPHLSVARKGAHEARFIRPMEDRDLDMILAAAERLPVLMVTIAPESVTTGQVAALAKAGITVSLGHTDASYDVCMEYADAGASCVTHLFNAMSQLGNREPGLVGAALTHGGLAAGIIADGIHVHPANMAAAWAAKTGPSGMFLVSDAMAAAGTAISSFELNGRKILRKGGRLSLEDGTLAGADLDMPTAVHVLVKRVGLAIDEALGAAISGPANVVGIEGHHLKSPGLAFAQTVRISPDLTSALPLVGEDA